MALSWTSAKMVTPEEDGTPAVENIGLGGWGEVVIKDVGLSFELTYSGEVSNITGAAPKPSFLPPGALFDI